MGFEGQPQKKKEKASLVVDTADTLDGLEAEKVRRGLNQPSISPDGIREALAIIRKTPPPETPQ
jgi:hypothetical protein